MSFLKKLTKGFDDLKEQFSDKDKEKGVNQQQHGGYGGPPPPPTGAPGMQLPPGWIQQWDQNSQRPYFVETATGRTQWEPPMAYGPPPGAPGGYGAGAGGAMSGDLHQQHQKKSGHGGMLAAGAGGLAVGAIGGAMLAHDSDEHVNQVGYGGNGGGGGAYYSGGPGYGQEAPLPENDPNLSSSERSSIKSAREELQEEQEEYREGSQSSSDKESLREAQEEYNEEVEEAYDE